MIKKNIKTTTITAKSIDVINGEIIVNDLPPVVTTRKVTDKNAEKIFRKESGVMSEIKITDYKTDVLCYEMDIETFMKHATIIEM